VAVLAELLRRNPPAPPDPPDGCGRVVLVHQPTHEGLIRLAFDEVRQAAAPMPSVCIYLLEALELLTEAANDGPPAIGQALRRQAELVVAGCDAADNLPADLGDVQRGFRERFGSP